MDNTQSDDRRFVYFYFNRTELEKIRQAVPDHVQYWKTANPQGYIGGPFADRTGGLISFVASNLEDATKLILRDPFILEDLIAEKWIKEWIPE